MRECKGILIYTYLLSFQELDNKFNTILICVAYAKYESKYRKPKVEKILLSRFTGLSVEKNTYTLIHLVAKD